jgi:tripartite-type tricarboxylate transporter receptor subunit TctC
MKRFIALVMSCLLVIGICACGTQSSNQTTVTPSPSPQTSASETTAPENTTPQKKTEWSPERPVTIYGGAGAGGGTDSMMRVLAAGLEEVVPGSTFNVIAMPGGGGAVAAEAVYNANHDGYTLLGWNDNMPSFAATGATKYTSKYWDIMFCGGSKAVLSVLKDSPYQTFDELLEDAKTKQLKYSSSSPFTFFSLKMAVLREPLKKIGVEFTYIPFEGSAATHVGLMSKEVDFIVTEASTQVEYYKSGDFRPLVCFEDTPLELPEFGISVPSILDYFPEATEIASLTQLWALAMPADCPEEVKEFYWDVFPKAMATDVVQKYLKDGYITEYGYIREEARKRAAAMDSAFSYILYDNGLAEQNPELAGVMRNQ